MKWATVIFSLFFFILTVLGNELPLAEDCDPQLCQLPNCRCSNTDIPGGLDARDTPQFVLVTFDDNVNVINVNTYRDILYGRSNSNGCPIGITYYINHEYNNYHLTNELYNQGFEIALHSISHRTPQQFWAQSTYEDMREEIGDQKLQMSHFANIPINEIKGVRIPFLQLTGNASFQVMAENDLLYDCTWPTMNTLNPGLWPYTLNYASTQDCPIPPCPTASISGPWVIPMVSWLDLNGVPCAMVDSCYGVPPLNDENAWFNFIVTNFERHYLGNRAPFGFYIHEWYLAANPAIKAALARFLDVVTTFNDAFVVNSADVIDWVKNPVPVNQYRQRACRNFVRTNCPLFGCGPLRAVHNNIDYWMQACAACPNVYPWTSNPLGI